jgi:transposase
MNMMPEQVDYVIGVDTHKYRHSAAVLVNTGGVIANLESEASEAGYLELLSLGLAQAPGRRVWAVEGTGSYGAGLAAFLQAQGEWVVEVERPGRKRRRRAKSDAIDAVLAARQVLGSEKPPANPRRSSHLQVLMTARNAATKMRTSTLNHLQAVVLGVPEDLRRQLRSLPGEKLAETCRKLRWQGRPQPHRSAVFALQRLAGRLVALDEEIAAYDVELKLLLAEQAPDMLARPGVGPISAGKLLSAWSHQGRIRSESAFANLSGSSPIEASSGQTARHRLNRGGDRQVNSALHTIAVSLMTHDPRTQEYVARRLAEGKSIPEIRRCLKRYLARSLFRLMERTRPFEQMYGEIAA